MAVVLISESAPGRWACNVLAAPTELYYYPDVEDTAGENAYTIGRKTQAGALVDGEVVDWFQGLGASNDAVLLTTCAIEIDDDANSPYKGKLRMKFTVSATA